MARLEILQPYQGHEVGDIIEIPGGVASVLVLNRVGTLLPPNPQRVPDPEAMEADSAETTTAPVITQDQIEEWASARDIILVAGENHRNLLIQAHAPLQREEVDAFAEKEGLTLVETAGLSDLYAQRDGLRNELAAIQEALGVSEDAFVLDAIRDLKLGSAITNVILASPAEGQQLEVTPTLDPLSQFEIPGLVHQAKESLVANDLWSAEKLNAASDEQLTALSGVGPSSVEKIRAFLKA